MDGGNRKAQACTPSDCLHSRGRQSAHSALCSPNSAFTVIHGLHLHPPNVPSLRLRLITDNCLKLHNEMCGLLAKQSVSQLIACLTSRCIWSAVIPTSGSGVGECIPQFVTLRPDYCCTARSTVRDRPLPTPSTATLGVAAQAPRRLTRI